MGVAMDKGMILMEHSYADKCRCTYSTQHYDFHYRDGSLAQKEIESIAAYQEQCYQAITSALQAKPDFKLQYYLLDTAQEVGEVYGDNDPCNGFASPPDTVFAVYNEDVQCIGMHEDTHLISYLRSTPTSAFLREGLAMLMDKVWWDKPNEQWAREFIQAGRYVPFYQWLGNDAFFAQPDSLTYPIAGAFTHFMVERLTMPKYLDQVYYAGDDVEAALTKALSAPLEAIDGQFRQWVDNCADHSAQRAGSLT